MSGGYSGVGWKDSGTHPLSQTNMSTLDQGIFDSTHLLEHITLSADAATVEFTGIPQGYKHLKVVVSAYHTGSGFVSIQMRFNGDATAGAYDSMRRWTDGAGTTTSDYTSATVMRVGVCNLTRSAFVVDIPEYATVGARKTAYGAGHLGGITAASSALAAGGGRWDASTAAITAVWLSPAGSLWNDTSRFSLYGMR